MHSQAHPDFLCKGIQAVPQQPPPREVLPVVGEVVVVLCSHVHRDDGLGTLVGHDIS